jgi:hypothetical protein
MAYKSDVMRVEQKKSRKIINILRNPEHPTAINRADSFLCKITRIKDLELTKIDIYSCEIFNSLLY